MSVLVDVLRALSRLKRALGYLLYRSYGLEVLQQQYWRGNFTVSAFRSLLLIKRYEKKNATVSDS